MCSMIILFALNLSLIAQSAASLLMHNLIQYCSNFLKTSDEVESYKLEKAIYNSIVEIVKKREELAVMSGEDRSFGNDFLGLLIKAHHDANEKLRTR